MLLIVDICSVVPGVVLGCYADSASSRDLSLSSMNSNGLTLESCSDYCFQKVRFFNRLVLVEYLIVHNIDHKPVANMNKDKQL